MVVSSWKLVLSHTCATTTTTTTHYLTLCLVATVFAVRKLHLSPRDDDDDDDNDDRSKRRERETPFCVVARRMTTTTTIWLARTNPSSGMSLGLAQPRYPSRNGESLEGTSRRHEQRQPRHSTTTSSRWTARLLDIVSNLHPNPQCFCASCHQTAEACSDRKDARSGPTVRTYTRPSRTRIDPRSLAIKISTVEKEEEETGSRRRRR